MIQETDLLGCPEVIIRYLKKAGVIGKNRNKFAHLIHEGEFRLKPKQRWFPIKGEYHFHPETPAFDWQASIKFFPFIFISVRDEYKNGLGRSLVKLQSLFTIADQSGTEISESSLGRLLVELILIPTALVPKPHLFWEPIDATHARVILENHGFKVVATFEFNSEDLPMKVSIDRFGNFDGVMKKNSFVCEFSKFKLFEGLLIPTEINGCWDLITEKFYWFHFHITEAHFE